MESNIPPPVLEPDSLPCILAKVFCSFRSLVCNFSLSLEFLPLAAAMASYSALARATTWPWSLIWLDRAFSAIASLCVLEAAGPRLAVSISILSLMRDCSPFSFPILVFTVFWALTKSLSSSDKSKPSLKYNSPVLTLFLAILASLLIFPALHLYSISGLPGVQSYPLQLPNLKGSSVQNHPPVFSTSRNSRESINKN